MAERSQNLQDLFLNTVRKQKISLTIFLINGVKLTGVVTSFDNFCVLLRRDGHSQLDFSLSLLIVAFGAMALTFEATDFEGGVTMAIAFFSNAGPVYEALIPPSYVTSPENQIWPQFGAMPVSAKITAVVIMTLGRLEVMIVFAVLNVRYWISR